MCKKTVSIHPDESLLQELRERQTTPSGRTKLRERVTVEHSLAHIGQWQGDRTRYIGIRKNLFDLRRMLYITFMFWQGCQLQLKRKLHKFRSSVAQ